jgi:hypothetical protein
MAARTLVTVGTDGFTDWIRMADGCRYNLGPISVLKFVSKLAQGGRAAQRTLEAFLRDGEAMLKVDENRMWTLLTPRRARWASDGSFMPSDQRNVEGSTMNTIEQDLSKIENHIELLGQAVEKQVSPEKMAEGVDILVKLAARVSNQSSNSAYYSVTEVVEPPVVQAPAPAPIEAPIPAPIPAPVPAPVAAPVDQTPEISGLSYNTYQENASLANGILTQAEEVNTRIDQLVEAGKKFNATKAKTDLHAITSKVAGILNDIDLTVSWVQEDLQKLAARAEHLHGLFISTK